MTHKKIHHHPYLNKAIIILLLMLLQLHTVTMLTIVKSSSTSASVSASASSSLSSESEDAKSELLSISSSDDERSSPSEEESLSKEVAAPLLTFSLRPGNNNGSLEQSNPDNNAGIHKAGVVESQLKAEAAAETESEAGETQDELHFYANEDNRGDNNDSNVSSESDTGEILGRFRREEAGVGDGGGGVGVSGPSPPEVEGSKAISTNWGTYEEQAPVVVHSGSRSIESDASSGGGGAGAGVGRMETDEHDDDSYAYGDEYQSNDDSSEYAGQSSISYDDYENGGFEGRQFYPSQRGGSDEHEPNGYYRQQQYYATARPLSQQHISEQGQESEQEDSGYRRPVYHQRIGQQRPNMYRQPQQSNEDEDEVKEESTGSSFMGFFQKAKQFYDIFQAMNSAWKTVESHYRKSGKGIFPQDLKQQLNQSTETAANTANQSVNNNTRKMNTKRLRTTKVPITVSKEDDQQRQQQQQEQQDTWQEKEEYRSRRSWLKETDVNDNMESANHPTSSTSKEDDSQISESDLPTDSSASASSTSSSSSTAIAEGRYIKGDPLKGYYDFVITEGSYKFWAVFQVGTALLIIYSTFAAIYYSKVNPLVSDYDYVDYLGGGRSLSDDSDFVDMDAPTAAGAAGAAANGSETTSPEGVSRSRQQEQSSTGWIGWLPHAGHTLRFILESIDKVYNEE